MTSVEDSAVLAISLAVAIKIKKRKMLRKKRSIWVKPWLLKRNVRGAYDTLLSEFRSEDHFEYQKFLRMKPEIFDELLYHIKDSIQKRTQSCVILYHLNLS